MMFNILNTLQNNACELLPFKNLSSCTIANLSHSKYLFENNINNKDVNMHFTKCSYRLKSEEKSNIQISKIVYPKMDLSCLKKPELIGPQTKLEYVLDNNTPSMSKTFQIQEEKISTEDKNKLVQRTALHLNRLQNKQNQQQGGNNFQQ